MIMAATHFTGPVVSPGGFVGPISGAVTGITVLTDSSGGTSGGNTVAAIPAATAATTDTTAASLASTNAAITAVKNDVATLAAKLNALIGSLD